MAELVAQRITSLLVEPFDLDGRTVTASVGVAFSGPAEHIPEALLRDADSAMYQAKAAGGGHHRVVDRGDRLAADHEIRIEGELRHALLADQLELAYQPIVRAGDGAMAGVEALLRWPHPERGLIPPDVVVPMAERAGLILAVGEWVLRRACTDFVQWRDDHGDVFAQLAVNVSARQVLGPCFARTVADVLRDTGMDPARLQLEVTESVMLDDSTRVRAAMDEIRRTGVQFSLDVFGMGYSCLFNLTLLPFDSVKIDCSSIAGVTGPDETPRAIIEMILELGRRCACRSWRRESRRRASWTRSSPSGRSSSRATRSASRCSPKRSNGGSSTCRRRDDPREQVGSAVVVVVEAMQRCS